MVVFHAKIIPHSAYVVWFSRQPLRHCRPRVSDTMAVRQNTVRKSTSAAGAASCRAASGDACCFRFWEWRSLGECETLAVKDAKKRKESAGHVPNVVQWFHIYDPIRS